MNIKTSVALAALSLAALHVAHAQEAVPANTWTHSAPSSTSSLASSGTRGAVSLSRAEVLADLQIYRESGLADLERGEHVDPYTDNYRAAEARYAELRSSPYFASLVRRLQQGERIKTAAR